MNKYCSIFCVIILTVIFLSGTCAIVFAAKEDFVDENYNFSNVRRVYLCKVDTSLFTALDASTVEKIQNSCKKFASKLKGVVFVEDEQSAAVKIIPIINVWENSSHYVPERVEVYYEGWEKRRVKDRDGKWITESHYKTSMVYFPGANRREKRIPAHWDYDSELKVSFEVYDITSNRLVMSRKDTRSRGQANHQSKMFKRSCKDFFKELGKKLKQS